MLNKLPTGWQQCCFEDVLDYEQPTKYIVKNTNYEDKGVAVLTAGKSFILGYTKETTGIFYGDKEPVIIFDDFTTSSKLVKFPFKVKSSAMKILHARDNINIDFIYYLMQTISYRNETHKRYWISEYAKQKLNLPPLEEQGRIVEKIEELFSDIDNGIKDLKIAQAQIKQYRQSVLKSAFDSKKLNIQKSLGDIIRIKSGDGLSSKNMDKNGEYPVFGGNGINGHHSTYNVSEQTIVIGRVGFYCGSVHITPNRAWITDNAFRVSFDVQKYDLKFIFWLLKNLNLNKYSVSTAQPVISGTKIYPIFTNVSEDKLEQQRIVTEIEKRFAVADEMEKAVNDSLLQAEKLKQSILKQAFAGKLVPQNSNDEPAAVLLERIKAAKENSTKGKK